MPEIHPQVRCLFALKTAGVGGYRGPGDMARLGTWSGDQAAHETSRMVICCGLRMI
jgi:hypothetical protein